jgi:hypothetical protein
MATSMKEIGIKIWLKDMELIIIKEALFTRASGKKTTNMEWELKLGQTVLDLKVTLQMDLNMAKVCTFGPTAVPTREIGSIIKQRAEATTSGLTAESMKAPGKRI